MCDNVRSKVNWMCKRKFKGTLEETGVEKYIIGIWGRVKDDYWH